MKACLFLSQMNVLLYIMASMVSALVCMLPLVCTEYESVSVSLSDERVAVHHGVDGFSASLHASASLH